MPSITIIITINDFGTIDCFSVFMTTAALTTPMEINANKFGNKPRNPHVLLDFSNFRRRTSHVGGCIFGSRQPSLRKDRACPRYRVAPLARQSLTRFENIKSLSSCFKRGRRIARITRADVVRMQGSRRKPSTKIPFALFAFPLRSLRYNIPAPLFFNAKVVRRLDSQRAREVVKKELVGTASGCLSIQTATRSRTSSGTCPRRIAREADGPRASGLQTALCGFN